MKLQIGEVYATKGVNADAEENKKFKEFINVCISRHINKDFGEMNIEDIETNNDAIKYGSRIFSSYKINENLKNENEKLWIITEAENDIKKREYTTILYPDEYQ